MIADPGWFYSSISQATAAIVALIGGLLGTRLIENVIEAKASWAHLALGISELRKAIFVQRVEVPELPELEFPGGKITETVFSNYANVLRGHVAGRPEYTASFLGLAVQCDDMARAVMDFRSRVVPPVVGLFIPILVGLTVVGLVWPLTMLPGVPNSSSKTWILSVFSLLLLGFLGYLSLVWKILLNYETPQLAE